MNFLKTETIIKPETIVKPEVKSHEKIVAEQSARKSRRRRRIRIWHAAVVVIIALLFYFLKVANYYPKPETLTGQADFFGITFSTKFCDELELDRHETYQALLDELQVKLIRLPVYWDEIEKVEGQFDFSEYDYLIDEGEKRGVKFIISIGRRVPRWPECHNPVWLTQKDEMTIRFDTLKMLETVVKHYQNRTSVEYWQVENEPFLGTFGVCPPLDENFLRREFNLVRSLDQRPIIITGSGELSYWKKEAAIGDIFGSTLYRTVYNSLAGYIKYPFPAAYYQWKARAAGLPRERLMVMELQAEPWVSKGKMIYLSAGQVNHTMSPEQLAANLQIAQKVNFSRAYLWGAEWWYAQKKYGNPEYWRIATELFKD